MNTSKAFQKKRLASVFASLLILVISIHASAQTKRIKPAPEHFFVKCKLLINPATGRTIKNAFIEVNNGKILAVGESRNLKSKPGVKVVDYDDKYIIPGLIDTHGHLFGGVTMRHTTSDLMPAFYLAAGVTTVRSPGSMEPEGDMGLRYRIDSGRFLGPRFFLSGPYIEADPVTVRWMNPVKTEEEVRLKVEQWIRLGATSVKIYAAMKGDLLRAAIEHGHAHGVKVIGHVDAVSYKEAIEMGIDELFHGVLAMPDVRPQDLEKKGPKDREAWYSSLDLNRPETLDVLRAAARARVVLTPTAVVVEPLEPVRNHMEEQKKYFTPEAWAEVEKRLKKPLIPNGEKILEKNKEFIRLAHRMGCLLSTGTDHVDFVLLPGYSLWREMEIFGEAGLKPMEVLKAATVTASFALGRSDLLGTVEEGKLADFVILNADPLDSISNVRQVHRVVKDGILYEPEVILKPLVGKYF